MGQTIEEKLTLLKWLAETCEHPENKALYHWKYERALMESQINSWYKETPK